MALRGNLRDFTVAQLLNLINLAHKTGTLIIEGPNEAARVAFRDGKLSFAQIGQEDNRLASVLHRANRLTTGQLRAIQLRAAQVTEKELGLLLINAGYMSQDDILNSLQAYFTDVIRRLFTWVEGFFRFENEILPPEDRITVRLDLENLIIEGARQLREWEQLQDEIPSLNMALKFIERPGANIQKMNLSVEQSGGALLVVSQFTLYGDTRRGRRPSFDDAAPPDEANRLYEYFVRRARAHEARRHPWLT